MNTKEYYELERTAREVQEEIKSLQRENDRGKVIKNFVQRLNLLNEELSDIKSRIADLTRADSG